MATLVIAEHDNATVKGATLNTVTAAPQCGGDVHVKLIAWLERRRCWSPRPRRADRGCALSKVLHADAAIL